MIFYLDQDLLPEGLSPKTILQAVSEQSALEAHMLPHSVDELVHQFTAGLSIVGIENNQAAAHATLWPLSKEENFYELGAVWVAKQMRGRQLGTFMYQLLLTNHQQKNILATTTNQAAIITGKRVGLLPIERRVLPESIRRASCICPAKKTGTENNEHCRLAWREENGSTNQPTCVFRVTKRTLKELGVEASTLP